MATEVIVLWGSNIGLWKINWWFPLSHTCTVVYVKRSAGTNLPSWKAKTKTSKAKTETVFLAFESQWGRIKINLSSDVNTVPAFWVGDSGVWLWCGSPRPMCTCRANSHEGSEREAVTRHLLMLHSIFLWISFCVQADINHPLFTT